MSKCCILVLVHPYSPYFQWELSLPLPKFTCFCRCQFDCPLELVYHFCQVHNKLVPSRQEVYQFFEGSVSSRCCRCDFHRNPRHVINQFHIFLAHFHKRPYVENILLSDFPNKGKNIFRILWDCKFVRFFATVYV